MVEDTTDTHGESLHRYDGEETTEGSIDDMLEKLNH
jgi:hypothetical protein